MDYNQLRNTVREWFRGRVSQSPDLYQLPLVVTNETDPHGVDVIYLRQSLQTGDASVIGIGSATRRSRRLGRIFIEVFGPKGDGEGRVSQLTTIIEKFFRDAMPADKAIHRDIVFGEPSTFERPEDQRYCQVVSVPIQVDNFS